MLTDAEDKLADVAGHSVPATSALASFSFEKNEHNFHRLEVLVQKVWKLSNSFGHGLHPFDYSSIYYQIINALL